MSYSRSYSATISGVARGSVSYPASEHGGSTSVSLSWSEPVYVNIHVDTSSFDHGVMTLKGHVDGLTGAMVATEAAQIAQKACSASSISQSVSAGFFTLIRSELTQQMVALRSRVDSLFLKLNEMKAACLRIQQSMKQDYERITDRYSKIFEELDRELAMRITALDRPSYTILREIAEQNRRSINSTLSTVPTIFAAENARAQSVAQAGSLRSEMNALLQDAVAYLVAEKNTSRDLRAMLSDEANASGTCFLPVLYIKADETDPSAAERVFFPPLPDSVATKTGFKEGIKERFRHPGLLWNPQAIESRAQIERFLIPLVDSIQTSAQDRDARVRHRILQLWNARLLQTLPL